MDTSLRLPGNWKNSQEKIKLEFVMSGFHVVESFGMILSAENHAECMCDFHGSEKCDCQIIVLLLYYENFPPVTLSGHSFNDNIVFSLNKYADQYFPPVYVVKKIFNILELLQDSMLQSLVEQDEQ